MDAAQAFTLTGPCCATLAGSSRGTGGKHHTGCSQWEALWPKMGESHTSELILAQSEALVDCQNIGDSCDQVIRVDLTLLLVKEAVKI